jgi:hypothetical protein
MVLSPPHKLTMNIKEWDILSKVWDHQSGMHSAWRKAHSAKEVHRESTKMRKCENTKN